MPKGGRHEAIAKLLNDACNFTADYNDSGIITGSAIRKWMTVNKKTGLPNRGYRKRFGLINTEAFSGEERKVDFFQRDIFFVELKALALAPWRELQQSFTEYLGEHYVDIATDDEDEFYASVALQCQIILCGWPPEMIKQELERISEGRGSMTDLHPLTASDVNPSPVSASGTAITFRPSRVERNAHFVGREEALHDIASYLSTDHIVSLYGMVGIGKSEVLRKFYLDHRNEYDHRVFIRWGTKQTNLSAWMELFSSSLGIYEGTISEKYTRAVHIYKEMLGRKLIVVDELPIDISDEVIMSLANYDAYVLISSIQEINLLFRPLELDEMRISDSYQLFCSYAGISLEALYEWIGLSEFFLPHRSPLFIEALARLYRNDRLSLKDIVSIANRIPPDRAIKMTTWYRSKRSVPKSYI